MKTQITEAAQTASLLVDSIRAAHKKAVYEHPLVELILCDALEKAVQIKRQMEGLDAAFQASETQKENK